MRPRQAVSKAATDRDAGQADDPEPDGGAPDWTVSTKTTLGPR